MTSWVPIPRMSSFLGITWKESLHLLIRGQFVFFCCYNWFTLYLHVKVAVHHFKNLTTAIWHVIYKHKNNIAIYFGCLFLFPSFHCYLVLHIFRKYLILERCHWYAIHMHKLLKMLETNVQIGGEAHRFRKCFYFQPFS